MRLRREVRQMEVFPAGYGVAWVSDFGHVMVCYPFGLHWVMRWVREWYWVLAAPPTWSWYTDEQIAKIRRGEE